MKMCLTEQLETIRAQRMIYLKVICRLLKCEEMAIDNSPWTTERTFRNTE